MNENNTPKRRPGRPEKNTRDALLDRGIDVFVRNPRFMQPGMKTGKVARAIGCTASTFADKFGQAASGAADEKGRGAPVAGFFAALRDRVLDQRPDVPADRVRAFLHRYGCVFAGASEAEIRRTLRALRGAAPELAGSELAAAAQGLGNVPDDPDRALLAVEVIVAIRALPPDAAPGVLLQAELDAIDAFHFAGGRDRWEWWRHYRIAEQLPSLIDTDTDDTVFLLRAEARARSGVALADILRAVDPAAEARGGHRLLRSALTRNARLAAARGYADTGRLTDAIAALPDAPGDELTLTTVARMWHAAIVAGDDAVVADLQTRAQARFDHWERYVTDEDGNWDEDAPDFEDSGADEGLALVAGPAGRLERLAALASEQLTAEQWQRRACTWSLPETVEVLVHYLEADGRNRDAQRVVADLLMTVRWGAKDSVPPSFPETAACERLAVAYPDAVEPARNAVPEIVRRDPVDTVSHSSRRLRHNPATIPTGNFGRLLDAVLIGDVELRWDEADAIRQLGWLLDQRAARHLRPS
jgi:hypothetical protein